MSKTRQFFNSVDVSCPYVECVWFMSKGKRDKKQHKSETKGYAYILIVSPVLIHAFSQYALHITTAVSVNENMDSK